MSRNGSVSLDTMSSFSDDDSVNVPPPTSRVLLPIITTTTPATSSSNGSVTSQKSIADGEILLLMQSLQEDESIPIIHQLEEVIQCELINEPDPYGCPLSFEEAIDIMPISDNNKGFIWNATLIPNEFIINGKVIKGINPRDIDIENLVIKPRRPTLPVTYKDFFSSITKVCKAGERRPRYIFHGILNGWPSLRNFELIEISKKRNVITNIIPSPKAIPILGEFQYQKIWTMDDEAYWSISPQSCCIDHTKTIYRIKLRGADWTQYGWSRTNPGFMFWFEAFHNVNNEKNHNDNTIPRMLYGTRTIHDIRDKDAKCTYIHMISHRYAKERESPRDLVTYHSICLLEWDHGKYCTVTEAAYLNGMGGYRGRSNWYDDKDEPINSLYSALPPEMIGPWNESSAEIRCYDVTAKNLNEFKVYMSKYIGGTKRFIDIQYTFSHPARITFRSRANIAQYLINYIMRDTAYTELRRNCQTYCADLCVLIAGKKNVQPFHPVIRIEYQNRTHLFLYEYNMYHKDKNKHKKHQQSIKK